MAATISNDEVQQKNECEEEAETKKTVLITGVTRGIGRALALELAKHGHLIIGCGRDKTNLDSLQLQLSNASPQNHLLFIADVKSDDSIRQMAHTVRDKLGSLDIIVNNAGVNTANLKFWEVPGEMFDNVIDINIKGAANVLRHFIPLMLPRNQGIIVNISSLYGRSVGPLASAYCASKWAIEGLSKSIAKKLPNGITIVALDPGIINTDMAVAYFGDLASQYQSPQEWALKATSMILNITTADNGATLIVPDPGDLPNLDTEKRPEVSNN
ncbi:NADPH-dependent pterin aldehyde reductase-like isoform X2 [Cucurbita maxima]|uniref:NADPH-dependent pterin aldehyde reductase-like isoform X2 n=1 Tax=Cucurbita maxima TaxID=3661 RepID=A0A6J1K4Z1_CUCMA|nr:NADPH-dependent pterin aldehyde reductase-like isoform X2 [Cucurbita maxima]